MSKGGKQIESHGKNKGGEAFDMEVMEDVLEDVEEPLPPHVQRRVNAMKNVHKEYLALEKQHKEEAAALDLKYEKLFAPLYLKQTAIANGDYEPTEAETRIEGEEPVPVATSEEKGIPKFWLTVLQNNSAIMETITENDEDALSYLKDIKCTLYEGSKGFEISFYFAENPYFTDLVLTKKYHLTWDDSIYGEAIYDHSEGCTINWKPGKNLTIKVIKKPVKNSNKGGKGKKTGAARVTTVEEPCDSFFHFFSTLPKVEEGEEEEAAFETMEQDFEIGCIIKDKLIPHSVLWFTGDALEYEDDLEDYDYDFDGEEGEEGEEEEEEEEEEEKPKKARTGRRGNDGKGFNLQPPSGQNGPAQPQQPECKQQ